MTAQPPEAPQITCCQCGQAMDAKFQRGVAHMPGFWHLTCINAGCLLWGYTFSEPSYPPANLAEYLAYEERKSS